MSDNLRDQIAEAIYVNFPIRSGQADIAADAVLALPAIDDVVALAELCAPLTIEQVARALELAGSLLTMGQYNEGLESTDDEEAIAAWEDKR